MGTDSDVLKALRQADLPFQVRQDFCLVQLEARCFRLRNGRDSYFVKLLDEKDPRDANELHVCRKLLAEGPCPAPRLVFAVNAGSRTIACWEWLEGGDLRRSNRHRLPDAFEAIGRFHLAKRHDDAVTSPWARKTHTSVADMLSAEVEFLCSSLPDRKERQCRSVIAALEDAYPTWIHGDFHPGNIYVTEAGFRFVDWGYATRSLNVFDLGYVQSVPLRGVSRQEWWTIGPREAGAVLPVYFQACGLAHLDITTIHGAVMLWSELVAHHNSVRLGNEEGVTTCRENIELLLAQHR